MKLWIVNLHEPIDIGRFNIYPDLDKAKQYVEARLRIDLAGTHMEHDALEWRLESTDSGDEYWGIYSGAWRLWTVFSK